MQISFFDYISNKQTCQDFTGVQISTSKHESGHKLVTFHFTNYKKEFLICNNEWDIIRHNHFSQ